MNNEKWIFIDNTNNKYIINNFGDVKNYKSDRVLKQQIVKGYKQVRLFFQEKQKSLLTHRLVAKAFIENPLNKKEVNHIDGNKLNNNVNNLEWNTRNENQKHAWENGLYTHIGEKCYNAKLKETDIINIRFLKLKGTSCYKIAKLYKVSAPTIRSIINNKTWKHVK